VKTTINYIASWLAAAAIGAAIGLAPIASAAPATPSSQDKVTNTTGSTAPAPSPFETGTSSLVPDNVGADPVIPYFPGMGRPF
jgi:hypothetical protein